MNGIPVKLKYPGCIQTKLQLFLTFLIATLSCCGGILGKSYSLTIYGLSALYILAFRIAESFIFSVSRNNEDSRYTNFDLVIRISIPLFAIAGAAGIIFGGAAYLIKTFVIEIQESPQFFVLIIAVVSVFIELLRDTSEKDKRYLLLSLSMLILLGAAVILGGIWLILDPFYAIVIGFFFIFRNSKQVYSLLLPLLVKF